MTKLSLRRLWKLYKQISMQHHSHTRRELVLLQEAFYSGARGVVKVLDHMIEQGEADEAQRTIRRFGRHVNVIMRKSPRRKAHRDYRRNSGAIVVVNHRNFRQWIRRFRRCFSSCMAVASFRRLRLRV